MDTPVPMPNTEVKHLNANGTWVATPWESRKSPGKHKSPYYDLIVVGTFVMPIIIVDFIIY